VFSNREEEKNTGPCQGGLTGTWGIYPSRSGAFWN